MTPSSEDLAKARDLIRTWRADDNLTTLPELERLVAAALAEARSVKSGHIRTDDGIDRKVNGVICLFKDGSVAGNGAVGFMLSNGGHVGKWTCYMTAYPGYDEDLATRKSWTGARWFGSQETAQESLKSVSNES